MRNTVRTGAATALTIAIALVAAGAAAAVAPTVGGWKGTTSAKRSMSFTVVPRGARWGRGNCDSVACLTVFAVNLKFRCPPPYRGGSGMLFVGTQHWLALSPVTVHANGHFVFRRQRRFSFDWELTASGTFTSATRAKGLVTIKPGLGGKCPKRLTYSWKAHR